MYNIVTSFERYIPWYVSLYIPCGIYHEVYIVGAMVCTITKWYIPWGNLPDAGSLRLSLSLKCASVAFRARRQRAAIHIYCSTALQLLHCSALIRCHPTQIHSDFWLRPAHAATRKRDTGSADGPGPGAAALPSYNLARIQQSRVRATREVCQW
jgi:hypothetical protein